MSKVEDAAQIVTSVEVLEKELERAANTLVPLIREYLKDVRTLRMAFAEEVQHIISSIRQLDAMTKIAPELKVFVESAEKLDKILTSDFTERVARLNLKA